MDLSKVLGDVYADDIPPSPRPTTPEWADDAHLDEAFANWTPGPPPEAPAAEHEMAATVEPGSYRRIDDDLAAALTEALSTPAGEMAPVPEHEPSIAYELAAPEPEPAPQPLRGWVRGDDDFLPSGGGRRRGLLSRLSR